MNKTKPTALITGASAGLGREFALQIAERRTHHLILVARRLDRLIQLKQEIDLKWHNMQEPQSGDPSLSVDVLVADISQSSEREQLFRSVSESKFEVSLLINNAGFGSVGSFINSNPETEMMMVAVNCIAPLHLMRLFLPGMKLRKQGCIINVCSTAAFQPLTYMSTYGATKAFLLSLSLAIAQETKRDNIKILAHCPGPTNTEFHLVAGLPEKISKISAMSAKEVVAQALHAADHSEQLIINGWKNRALAIISRHLPLSWSAALVERALRSHR